MVNSNITRTRIAPTPSGYLHLGNIYSFVLTALIAKKESGSLTLRIDDLDSERTRDEYLEDIFEQLNWLQIPIDFGPSSITEFREKYSQHLKINLYSNYIKRLEAKNCLYACDCTRSKIQQLSLSGVYTGFCRLRNLPHLHNQLRVLLPPDKKISFHDELLGAVCIDLNKTMGDFVIFKKTQLPSYQLASAVDDLEMNMNLIVRGEDLIPSTAAQVFLSQLWGKDISLMARFYHHPLILENKDKKLSKSHDSLSLHSLREKGISSGQIYQYLTHSYGLSQRKCLTFKDLLEEFALSDLKLHTIQKVEL